MMSLAYPPQTENFLKLKLSHDDGLGKMNPKIADKILFTKANPFIAVIY